MPSRAVRLTTSAGCVAFACSFATDARAEDLPTWVGIFANPGTAWRFADGPVAASGPGFELSAGYSWLGRGVGAERFFMPHAGAVLRAQQIGEEDGPDIGYFVVGAEGGFSVLEPRRRGRPRPARVGGRRVRPRDGRRARPARTQ